MVKHFLYLTNDKLVSLVIKGPALVERENFAVSGIATPEFESHIETLAADQTYIVTDLIEEDFRLDTIPHLRGGDREAVLDRKLGQIYRSSPFRHAIVQGREEEGRRDDRVFLHAVTNADLLKPLISVLERYRVPLEGIYSSAVLSSLFLKELDVVFPHTMLVTVVPDFGLRQTYFKGKQVKFSRLTSIAYDESRSVGELIAAETSRTWQYLDSLRYFAEADSLEVCMLAHERDRAMMQEAIRSYPMLRYRFLDINEVADKLKISPAPTSSHAEEILCHLYSRSKLDNHFAAPAERRFASYRRARIAVFGVTAAILAAGAAGAAFNLFRMTEVSQEIDQRGQRESALQREFQSVVNSMSAQKMATDSVRDTSSFFNAQIRPAPASPAFMLTDIAKVLNDFPTVHLNQILWATHNDPTFVPLAPPGLAAVAPNADGTRQVTSESKAASTGAAPAASPADLADPPLSGNKYHIAVLEAAIQPFKGDVRGGLAEIDRLVKALQTNPENTVKITRMPVDPGPLASLKVIDRADATATQAGFAIHIARKVPGT